MDSNFQNCVDFVLFQEGGFVNNPRDPGGATKYGITKRTLERNRKVAPGGLSVFDVQNLTREEAAAIYKREYWPPFASLPLGLDLMAFDFGVNAGPGRAQQVLRLKQLVRGDYGPIGPAIDRYAAARLAYYQTRDGWATFGRGWARRTEECRVDAHKMAEGQPLPLYR